MRRRPLDECVALLREPGELQTTSSRNDFWFNDTIVQWIDCVPGRTSTELWRDQSGAHFMANLKVAVSSTDHQLGSTRAPVTLVEYGDYQCPHCAAAAPIVRNLRTQFGAQLRFVFRNFPLSEIHPHADAAAQVAEFADDNGKFWPMHDLLFENQSRLNDGLFVELAEQLDLSTFDLREALALGLFKNRVEADVEGGVQSGVDRTPTFFINSRRYDGPNYEQDMSRAIKETLTRSGRR